MNNLNKKPVVLIIGNLYNDPVPELALKKLTKILGPITNGIQVIAGDIINDNAVQDARIYNRTTKSVLILIIESIKRQIKAVSLMRNKSFDICIVLLPFLILPITYIKLQNKPLILYIGGRASKSIEGEIEHGAHNKFFLYHLIRLIEITAFTFANKLIVESYSAVSFLGLSNYTQKIDVRGQYIDLSHFNIQKKLQSRKMTIGYIGRLSKEKGIIEFIQAASLIAAKEKNINFLIAGVGDLTSEVLQYVQSNPDLSECTKFIGWVDPKDMPKILNELIILVLPSYSEGIPNIVLESMACGTPVLATPVGGLPDIIRDEETGFIIKNNLPDCIAEGIKTIINYPNLDSVVESARQLVEKEFGDKILMEKYRNTLDSAWSNCDEFEK